MDLVGCVNLVQTTWNLHQPFSNKGFDRYDAQMTAILMARVDEVDPRIKGVAEDDKKLSL